MAWDIVERTPAPSEYNTLRAAVGWGVYEEAIIKQALPRSLFCVCAIEDDTAVGMARLVGDGGLVYYIQDVIVLPDCQRRGIGTALMARINDYLLRHSPPGAVIGLMSAKGWEPWYEKYGFVRRPDDRLGCGMTAGGRYEIKRLSQDELRYNSGYNDISPGGHHANPQ